MSGHRHVGDPSMTQNQGNVLGDRPCVRQSKLYREHVGGNAMKELMGQDSLKWDTNRLEGAYTGSRAQGPASEGEERRQTREPLQQQAAMPQQQQQAPRGRGQVAPQEPPEQQPRAATGVDSMRHRPGAGVANRQTFNIFGGN